MKLPSKIASSLLVAAGLIAGQTAPANSPPPAVAESASSPGRTVAAPANGSPTLTDPAKSAAPKASDSPQGKPASPAGDSARYVLGPNDVVEVSVWRDVNLSRTYTIGPDGRMSMHLINDFRAAGLTVPELRDLITEKLKGFINDPQVNIQLLRVNSKKYLLVGGVLRAGPVTLLQETTVLDALAAAGGFKDFANKKKIVIRRGAKTFPFNYNDVIKGKHTEQNIQLQDGDIIIVPEQ
jgi:polysaccharide export outer membrane protein